MIPKVLFRVMCLNPFMAIISFSYICYWFCLFNVLTKKKIKTISLDFFSCFNFSKLIPREQNSDYHSVCYIRYLDASRIAIWKENLYGLAFHVIKLDCNLTHL